jgi:heme/copper-type cytochrome/quinol oxidase subunit 2
MWVMPDATGEYLIQCREYCGFSHYQMRAKLFVEEPIVDAAAAKVEPKDVQVSLQDSASAVVASN